MLEIRNMSLQDLELALEWAALEGWNPGLEDAAAFHGADPDGFFMAWEDDKPVAAISAMRYGQDFGFIGLYLCLPAYRGKGYGWAIWQAGMEYLKGRCVGLDGVPDQQANYQKSGFHLSHGAARYGGLVKGVADPRYKAVSVDMLDGLVQFDASLSGIVRDQYISKWFTNTDTRKTLVGTTDGKITSIGTIRACREGHKVGPLYAQDMVEAQGMLQALVQDVSANTVFLDVPQVNVQAVEMAVNLDMQPAFATARMYTGVKPDQQDSQIFGVVTLELS